MALLPGDSDTSPGPHRPRPMSELIPIAMARAVRRLNPRRSSSVPVAAPSAVVLVLDGGPASPKALDEAAALASGGRVTVLSLLTIYGSAFGFPNPGLLPNARERQAARQAVAATIEALESLGLLADGQVTATRSRAKVIAALATARSAPVVVLEDKEKSGLRGLLEGDLAAQVSRRTAASVQRVERTDE
jgi:hypothetical protein